MAVFMYTQIGRQSRQLRVFWSCFNLGILQRVTVRHSNAFAVSNRWEVLLFLCPGVLGALWRPAPRWALGHSIFAQCCASGAGFQGCARGGCSSSAGVQTSMYGTSRGMFILLKVLLYINFKLQCLHYKMTPLAFWLRILYMKKFSLS